MEKGRKMEFKPLSVVVLDHVGSALAFECVEGAVGLGLGGVLASNKKTKLVSAVNVMGDPFENDEVVELVEFRTAGLNSTDRY